VSGYDGVVFETDPLTRSVTIFHYDEDTGRVTLEERSDVTAIIENNKALQNTPELQPDRKSELRKVASIPMAMYQMLRNDWAKRGLGWEERQAEMRTLLNNPDFRLLRTDDGRKV
jgi:hypothetical protein